MTTPSAMLFILNRWNSRPLYIIIGLPLPRRIHAMLPSNLVKIRHLKWQLTYAAVRMGPPLSWDCANATLKCCLISIDSFFNPEISKVGIMLGRCLTVRITPLQTWGHITLNFLFFIPKLRCEKINKLHIFVLQKQIFS